MFKRLFYLTVISCAFAFLSPKLALAQTASPTLTATDSATSTQSANLATPSAEVTQKIQEKKDSDITESGGKQKSILAQYLEENPIESLTWNNFLEHSIRRAVGEGVPANVIVLVLLFPLIASIIAASRHIIGFRGFGIYIPAVLAVALASTGILEGLIIFLSIVVTALITKRLLKKTKMSYLPRTALLIWTVSLGILGLLMFAPLLNLVTLMSVNIFPILILVLLSENFLDALSRTKPADAIALTIESLSLAIVSSFILGFEQVQKFALTEPELLLILTVAINIVVAKFAGLRLSEFLRFRSIIEE